MNNLVFVCFVQNNIGFFNGEEEISCLMVTQSQEKIDKWLEKQVAEAEENGYFSDEDINGYKGRFDYTITLSKGNEVNGFDCYFLVCRPAVIE